MPRKFRITVDGRQYDVTVEELSEVSSIPYADASAYTSGVPAGQWKPPVAAAASAEPVSAPRPAAPGAVVCTLGGMVDSVLVTVGQQVNAGDPLMVIEAMKMKTPIVSPVAGKVVSILVKPGESVETGQTLVDVVSS